MLFNKSGCNRALRREYMGSGQGRFHGQGRLTVMAEHVEEVPVPPEPYILTRLLGVRCIVPLRRGDSGIGE